MVDEAWTGPAFKAVASIAFLVAVLSCSEPGEEAPQEFATRIELRPDLVVGVVEGPEEESFGRITGLTGDEEGRLYVLDSQADAVRVFDSDGEYLFSFGRWGEGPGELTSPCCLGWDPTGLLWIRDGGNARYSAFRIGESGADFIRSVHQGHAAANLWAETTFSRDGHLVDVGVRPKGSPPRMEHVRLFLNDRSGIDSVEVIEPPPPEALGEITVDVQMPEGPARLFFAPPFAPRHLLTNGPEGRWAEAISSEYVVVVHDGARRTEIRRPDTEGPELSAEEHTRGEERIAADVRRSGRSSLPLEVPDRKPPLQGLYFDGLGRLWVELSVPEGQGHRAHVYSPDGDPVAEATWPADLELGFPAWVGNGRWSLAFQIDSLGVERVVRLVQVPVG